MIKTEAIWALRIVIALLCGGAIGYERSRQFKSAGIRTHIVVAIGSALIAIASKYGFYDILAMKGMNLDPSRVAAQIVSGIGFIGAGMIMTNKTKVSGLTTAAGIWSTAAIGMTVGFGLYLIAIFATIMIVCIQFIFHDDTVGEFLVHHVNIRLSITASKGTNVRDEIEHILEKHHVSDPEVNATAFTVYDVYLQADGSMDNRKTDISDIIMDLDQCDDVKEATSSRR